VLLFKRAATSVSFAFVCAIEIETKDVINIDLQHKSTVFFNYVVVVTPRPEILILKMPLS
jgi:ribosomal silencing factor RsfS